MNEHESVWEDRDIRFDARSNLLGCRKGEMIVDSINSVEDTKGNNGERGSLIVTNLRIIWVRIEIVFPLSPPPFIFHRPVSPSVSSFSSYTIMLIVMLACDHSCHVK